MENLKRRTKKVISIFLIIVMLINLLPNILLIYANDDSFGEIVLRKGYYNENDKVFALELCVKDMTFIALDLTFAYPSDSMEVIKYEDYIESGAINTAKRVNQAIKDNSEVTGATIDSLSDIDKTNGKVHTIVAVTSTGGSSELYDAREKETILATIYFHITDENMEVFDLNSDMFGLSTDEYFSIINGNETESSNKNIFKIKDLSESDVSSITSLSVKNNPTEGSTYTHGDIVNLLGGKLTATYVNGETKDISMLDENVIVTTGDKQGAVADIDNPTLTFEYEGKKVNLDINVVDPVDKIQFFDKDDVLKDYRFLDGDTIPVDELYIKSITKSGKEKEIKLNDSKISLDSNEADASKIKNPQTYAGELVGIQEIQITYSDENVTKTTSFNILVNDSVGEIKISSTNIPESDLIVNDDFEKTGAIEIIGKYSGYSFGEIEIASDDVIVTEKNGSKIDLSKVVTNKILKVSYMDVSTTYTVNVKNTVVSIKTSNSIETKYDEILTASDFAGITLTEVMADGTTGNTKAIEFSWVDTSTYDNKSLSKQNIKIKYPYNGKIIEGTVEIKVKNELLGIRIENLQTNYVYLDELDYENAELYVEYISGETGPYEIDESVLTNNFNNHQIGEQEVTFTYSDGIESKSVDITLNVGRAIPEKPDCHTLEILEDVALSTIQSELPTTTYGSVIWENPSQTLSVENGENQTINAVYKMNETWKEFYQDVPMTVNVAVKTEEISSISLKTAPALEYYEGQTLDVSALELNVIYKDGTTGVISGGYTIEGIELDKPLTREDNGKTIKIKYKDFEPIELNITVEEDEVIGIVLNTEEAKTEYKYNEELDLSNITVKKVMASGIEQEEVIVKDNEEVTVSNNYDKTNITDIQTIEVTYAGFTQSYTVQVKDYVAKIELTNETKGKLETQYNYGDTIKVTGKDTNEKLYINVYMASDMQNPVQEELVQDMITADTSKLGNQEVVVEHREASTTFNITVSDYVSAIEIVNQPTKRIYNIGETLDTNGLIVRDIMASEVTIEAKDTTLSEDEYDISVLDSSVAGTKSISITRKNISVDPVTFTVLVIEDNADLEIQINKLPTEKTYYGKEINLTGGSIIVKPEGALEGTIIDMTDSSIKVEGYNPTQRGTQTVKLKYTYDEKTLEVDLSIVVVDYRLESIKITSTPKKLTYNYGEDLSLEGGEVARLMASGIEFAKNPLTNDMVSGFDPNKLGTQVITVTYQGLTTTFEVTVVDNVYGIAMNSNPDKVIYNYGEELNITGATIKVQKDSGVQIVPVTIGMISGYDKTKSGEQLITVSYEGFKTQFTVTVNKKVSENTGNDSGTGGSGDSSTGETDNSGTGGNNNSGNSSSGNQGVINKAEYIVIFKDYDGTILKKEYIKQGETANPPQIGIREGYNFIGWDKDYTNIQDDIVLNAQYEEIKEDDNKVEETPIPTQKPTQTLGEKDEQKEEKDVSDTLIPAIIGLSITGTLLLLISIFTKKNVEIYIVSEERKLVGKIRLTKKEKTIYMDEYKDEVENSDIEIILSSKIAQKLDGEEINVVLKGVEKSYIVKANGEENITIKIK